MSSAEKSERASGGGVRFGRVSTRARSLEPMAVVVEVDEEQEEQRRDETWRTLAVFVVAALVAVAWLASAKTQAPRTDGEWSLEWRLDVEKSSDDLEPATLLESSTVVDGGLLFDVHLVAPRKKSKPTSEDPLAHIPKSLVIRDSLFDDQYRVALNKFPVLTGHSLLIAKDASVQQSARLTRADLDALHRCALAVDGLGFYNSHPESGSSQKHRHFQLVPFASFGGERRPGTFAALQTLPPEPNWRWSSNVPFIPAVRRLAAFESLRHGLVRLPDRATFGIDFRANKGTFADALLRAYAALAADLGLFDDREPHNILLTDNWLLAVRRTAAKAHNVSLNALGFAGTLALADEKTYTELTTTGLLTPLDLLRAVSLPAAASSSEEEAVRHRPPGPG